VQVFRASSRPRLYRVEPLRLCRLRQISYDARPSVPERWNYDVEQGRVIETFGGLEYNDCCWQLRLLGRRFLNIPTGPNLVTGQDQEVIRPEDGIFLQIVFKGMGGVGNGLESMVARGIRGYRTENYDDL
jgi:lipopolysaccharide assembly outer membrane protein LptD (OstA)